MAKRHFFVSLVFLVFSFLFFIYTKQNTKQPSLTFSPSITPILGEQTKSADCITQGGMPDTACTPGAVFANVTTQQICTAGYSASVRNVNAQTKKAVYAEYGVLSHPSGSYEVDHLISLELGGSNEISNLWPEAASPTPGFHEKDLVENYLHDMVCKGKMSLGQAQDLIAHHWLDVYKSVPNIQEYNWNGNHN